MKRMIFSATVALLLASCSTQPRFTVTGTFAEPAEKAYLWNRNSDEVVDSVVLEAGAFRFEGLYTGPMELSVVDAAEPNKARQYVSFLVEEGDVVITPTGERRNDYCVVGTPANDAYTAYHEAQSRNMAELLASTDEKRRAELEQAMHDLEWELIAANTHNLIAPLQLRTETYDLSADELMGWIERFSPEIQQTDVVQELVEVAEKKRRTEVGQPYIDFELPDMAGNPVSLKSVIENPKNRYVLLDFWASWCGPCMAEMPYLKEAYAAYHERGFEIVGVTLDWKQDAWLKAIENHRLNWIQLGKIVGVPSNEVSERYGVQGIPSNFLFDCLTGKILAVNLRGEAVKARLAELLQ